MNPEGGVVGVEDLLCDACLYKMESNGGEIPVADMCKRCRKKLRDNFWRG